MIGNGNIIYFWEDEWVDDIIIRAVYPRIYALATNKSGKVRKFGSWVNGKWQWEVELRKRVLDWEIEAWNHFQASLRNAVLIQDIDDKLI